MSKEGQGIGKADGFAVFVRDAVVGDVVEAEMTKVKKITDSQKSQICLSRLLPDRKHSVLIISSAADAFTRRWTTKASLH